MSEPSSHSSVRGSAGIGLLTGLLGWLLASCAGEPLPWTTGVGSNRCGDLCVSLPCPQAYRCSVTSRCQRRCDLEDVGSGRPWR